VSKRRVARCYGGGSEGRMDEDFENSKSGVVIRSSKEEQEVPEYLMIRGMWVSLIMTSS